MELPTYEEHCAYYEQAGNIVEISHSAFYRVALEYNNPYGVAIFSVIDLHEPYERIIFIDEDLFKAPRPSNPDETFEDIKKFAIEHEMAEQYGQLQDKILGRRELVDGVDVEHDEIARYTHLKAAHEAGLLDKMVEFHMLIQLICQQQLEDYYGRPRLDGPDAETLGLIQKTQMIAERIRREAALSINTSPEPDEAQ